MAALNLASALALYSIDALPPEHLPGIAADIIAEGFDSPSLRLLAGLMPPDPRQARDLFVRAIDELGATVPPPEEGLRVRLRDIAERLRGGSLAPIEAADLAWSVYSHSRVRDTEPMRLPEDLQAVWNLMDCGERWRAYPEGRQQVDREIRDVFDRATSGPRADQDH